MKTTIVLTILLVLCCNTVFVYSQQSGSCSRCNCAQLQLKSVEIIRRLVQSIVKETLNETFQSVQQQINASIDEKFALEHHDDNSPGSSSVVLQNISGNDIGHVRGAEIARINSFSPSTASTSTNNLLAYRPNYRDSHTSGLAALFVNIEGVFPCIAGTPEYYPVCKLFTYDEDGFRNGRAVIDVADCGNDISIFGGTSATFGFGFSGCSTMTTDCFSVSTEYSIVCLLPRSRCG